MQPACFEICSSYPYLVTTVQFLLSCLFLNVYKSFQTEIKKDINIYILTSSNNLSDIAKAKEISALSGNLLKPISKEGIINLISHFTTKQWCQNEF